MFLLLTKLRMKSGEERRKQERKQGEESRGKRRKRKKKMRGTPNKVGRGRNSGGGQGK